VTFANKQTAHLFGLSVEQMRSKSLSLFLTEIITEPTAGPTVARHTSGAELQVDVVLTKLDAAWVLLLRDITGWRQALPDDQNEEHLRLVLETIPAMVYSRTPYGNVDYANRRATEFFGMGLEQIYNGGWIEALHPDEKDDVLAGIDENFRKGEPYQMEYRRRSATDRYRCRYR
jgi:PAS domain S-box-containing protein